MTSRLEAVGERTRRADTEQAIGSATRVYGNLIGTDALVGSQRVRSSFMALAAALDDQQSVSLPRQVVDRARVAAALSDNDHASFDTLRRRQVNLLEVAEQVRRMSDERFGAFDVAAHMSLADALVRYTTAWARFYAVADRRLDTNTDLESIDATLADVLAVGVVGFRFDMTGVSDSAALASVASTAAVSSAIQDLAGLRRREDDDDTRRSRQDRSRRQVEYRVPALELGAKFVQWIRNFIELQLGLALSDAFLFVWVGVDYLDVTLPQPSLTSALVAGASPLLRWLETSPSAFAPLNVATPNELALVARTVLAPYSVTKYMVGGALAAATRYLFASPLARVGVLDSIDDASVLFALPLWQVLIVLRLTKLAIDKSAGNGRRVGSTLPIRQNEVARAYLDRQRALQMPVSRAVIADDFMTSLQSSSSSSASSDDEYVTADLTCRRRQLL